MSGKLGSSGSREENEWNGEGNVSEAVETIDAVRYEAMT